MSGRRVAVRATPPFVSPETRRPAGVARLHSRRGGTNQYRPNGADYEYQGWAKLDDRSGPGLMIELTSTWFAFSASQPLSIWLRQAQRYQPGSSLPPRRAREFRSSLPPPSRRETSSGIPFSPVFRWGGLRCFGYHTLIPPFGSALSQATKSSRAISDERTAASELAELQKPWSAPFNASA